MKSRSPWGLYAVVFATGGLFGWVWLVILMNDVNVMVRRRVFPTKVLGLVFAAMVAGYCAFLTTFPHRDPDIPGLSHDLSLLIGCAIALTLSPPVFLVFVSRQINAAAGRPPSVVANLKVFFLTLFMFIGFPMVQQNMNDLIAEQSRRP